MAIFDKQSNFKKESNFSSVIIGADAPVLEVELNEMQEIQRERLRTTLKALFLDGVKGTGEYEYDFNTSILTVQNELLIINGEILEITEGSISANEGDTIYVEVWEEIVTCNDQIPKYGNVSSLEYIENYLIDPRIGMETSRRNQTRFRLSTITPRSNPYIILGRIQNNNFNLVADSITTCISSGGSTEQLRPYKRITLSSGAKRFNLYVSPKGELLTTEVDANTPISPQIILRDPQGSRWNITVNDLGEVCTKPVTTGIVIPNLYLQASEPYAVIYKVGVSTQGEIYTAPICDLDLIRDNNIGKDITWSSSKIAQTFDFYNTELSKLRSQIAELEKKLGGLR